MADILIGAIVAGENKGETPQIDQIRVLLTRVSGLTHLAAGAYGQDEDDWMDLADACLGLARLATELAARVPPSEMIALPGVTE